MTEGSDRIVLRGLRGHGFHGVYDAERSTGQLFVVDVELALDLRPAAGSDDVTDTVDYGRLAEQVLAVVVGEPVALVETLAQRVADVCLADPRVVEAAVTVHKPEAPITVPFDDVAVTIVRSR
ncbi:MAG TPA: dihydroneopterin aldolase [Actinomycetes bacterium]|nr:dihydroneopterin aldolase [Actinomycetes bacterium]